MLVSVIISAYNEEKVIGECLGSLLKQSYKDMEIIIIDDGSTDKTLQVLQKFQITNSKLQILKQGHKGPGEARNLGARHAKGKILVFVDADMVFDKDFIKKLVEPIVKGETKGTFSKEEYVANWENVWARCWNINSNLPAKKRLPNDYPDHQKVFRAILKSEFGKVGGFSKGGYTDDWTLSEKLGYEAKAVPSAVFYHENPGTLSETYKQAKWIAKRKYKMGDLGYVIVLVRNSIPISIVLGLYKGIKNYELRFLIFKIIYDLGIFVGIFEMLITGKTAK